MTMSENDLSAVRSRALVQVTKVRDEIIRPNLQSDGYLWGSAERPLGSPHFPQITTNQVWSFFGRIGNLSIGESSLQHMMYLWASNYDKDVVSRVIRENRVFDDSEIQVTFEGLQKDISDAGRSLIERIKLSKVALVVPGKPNDHAFAFSWPFVDWICLLYDQLDPILAWSRIDDRTVFLYRTLIDATYKIHRIFNGQPIDFNEFPPGIDFRGAAAEPPVNRTVRESLELMIHLAEGMEIILNQIDEQKSQKNDLQNNDLGDKSEPFRPVLNETEFQVLLALYHIGQPQSVRFVRNEVNRHGNHMAEREVTKICSKLKVDTLGLVSLQRKQWFITDSGKGYIESDLRFRQS